MNFPTERGAHAQRAQAQTNATAELQKLQARISELSTPEGAAKLMNRHLPGLTQVAQSNFDALVAKSMQG